MPNITVLANAEGMPKFDKAAIMRTAWEIARKRFPNMKTAADRRFALSLGLKSAWMGAKYEAQQATKTAHQRAAARVEEMKLELMRLDATPFKIRLDGDKRAALASRIDAMTKELAAIPA